MTDPDQGPGPAQGRLSELDGIRAVAILMVIAFHSWFFLSEVMTSRADYAAFVATIPWPLAFVRRGDLGVDVFFVLSGFLLGQQLLRQLARTGRLEYRRYFAHRLLRIYPLYLVALAIAALAAGPSLAFLGNLLAYNIWFLDQAIIIPWTWSLSVELEFYLIIPFVALVIGASARAMIWMGLAAVALAVGWSVFWLLGNDALQTFTLGEMLNQGRSQDANIYFHKLYYALPIRISQFMAGIAAAWLMVFRREQMRTLTAGQVRVLALAGMVGLLVPAFYNPFVAQTRLNQAAMWVDYIFGRPAFAAGVAAFMVLMLSGHMRGLRRVLSVSWLQPVARYSYSMYLFHPVFMYPVALVLLGKARVSSVSGWQVVGIFALTVAATLLFGALTWRLIERPAIRFGKRHFDH